MSNSSMAADTLWTRTYNGPAGGSDVGSLVRVDSFGSLYIGGSSYGVGTNYDFLVLKYDSHGDLLWERRYDGPTHGDDELTDMAVDSSGCVYVTGPSGADVALVKWGGDGALEWD